MSVYKLVVLNTFNGFFFTKFDPTLDIWQSKSHYFYSVLFMKLTRWLRGGDRRVTRALRNKVAKFDLKITIFTNSNQIEPKMYITLGYPFSGGLFRTNSGPCVRFVVHFILRHPNAITYFFHFEILICNNYEVFGLLMMVSHFNLLLRVKAFNFKK